MSLVETRIAGLKGLLAGLDALPGRLEEKAIWSALGGAAVEIKKLAIEKAPELERATNTRTPGTVKRAIRVQRSKFNKGQNGFFEVIVRVKPLGSKRKREAAKAGALSGANNPNDPYYWRFLEFGTSKMAKRPFLRPAFEGTKDVQLTRIRVRMKLAIEKEAKKIAEGVNRDASLYRK